MKKNLLHKETADEIIARAEKLRSDTANHWGKMNVTEMLYHCNISNQRILEDELPYQKPTMKERFIKFAAHNILPKFPKNNKGPARTDTKGRIDPDKFEEQKKIFIELITRFPEHKKPFASLHPAMGFLTPSEWGLTAWMHMDHHLRQFGV